MGLGRNGDIRLRDMELRSDRQYHDSPAKAAMIPGREMDRDSDGLGSLAGSPESSPAGNGRQNHFRDELRRQEGLR